MSTWKRTHTVTFVTFVALTALSGCGTEPRSFAERVRAARIDGTHLDVAGSDTTTVPVSRVLGTPSLPGLDTTASGLSAERARESNVPSPARLALRDAIARPESVEPTFTLVVGTDVCETDADCVPDGCHATSCVAVAEMAPGELACSADLQYGTTDGGGCLCHVGHCAARLSTPPQGI